MKQILFLVMTSILMLGALVVYAQDQSSREVVAYNWASGTGARVGSYNNAEDESMKLLISMKKKGEWTDYTKLLLSQALWGESGISPRYKNVKLRGGWRRVPCEFGEENERCYENLDWKLIPWVLLKRWEAINQSKRMTFGRVIQSYCAPLDPELSSYERETRMKAIGNFNEVAQIKRRRFIQSLEWNGEELKGMAKHYGPGLGEDFLYHGWKALTSNVIAWGKGEVPNLCKKALHWDRVGAETSLKLPRINCGKTLNAFYGEL